MEANKNSKEPSVRVVDSTMEMPIPPEEEINNKGPFIDYPNESLQGLHTNRAISNKWIGFVPIESALGKNYKNLELELRRFTIPQVNVGTSTTSFKGISYELPTHVLNPDSREITFEYVVDADWYNYKALYLWASSLGTLNPVDGTALKASAESKNVIQALGTTPAASGIYNDLLNCRVWLLSPYKKRIIDFTFYNCFIKSFSDLALDMTNAEEITHSFSLAYTHMTIDDPKT